MMFTHFGVDPSTNEKLKLLMFDVHGDGNCLYRAAAVALFGCQERWSSVK